ncbi:hypothetical protein BD410DRAFT_824995 [Rickenella mellea]|uniref:SHSP domain-containing protein n=1 Tax=Rickenella mellea TaxID=50990 RepID=A0A4Y7QJH8_9AGAM|nr:hypothetical protein BD410DRAFT_824995 [Rickenella mellea]
MADSFPTRPPLTRGNTVPLYVRRDDSYANTHDQHRQDEPRVFNANGRPHPNPALRPPEGYRRDQSGYAQSNPASPIRPSPNHHWPSASHPPTPPLSISPSSTESNSDDAYSRGYLPTSNPSNPRSTRPHGPYQISTLQPLSAPMAPSVFTPPATESSSLSLLRSSRAPPPQQHVKMRIESTPTDHILSAPLGPGFNSDHITIACRKGNVLDIVADRWDQEKDCHYEWQVQFDRDADMSSVRASYTAGVLQVTVKRIVYPSRDRPPFAMTGGT